MNAHAGTAVVERNVTPIAEIRVQLDAMETQFKAGLPAHIPAERFMRVVMTAIQNNPQLLKAPRKELWNACMKAAQDGLLPDGREGALVCRPGRDGVTVTWQPMIAGIRKKARNSGEIATWDAHVVYDTDHFQFQLGDAPQINHSRDLKAELGKIVGAYSVALMKDGSKSYEVMTIAEIYKIRDRSDAWKAFKAGKIKSTPWSTDEGEMCRKTVAKRHSKVLPMSTDLDDLIRRDDDLYDMKGAREDANAAADAAGRPRTLAGRLDLIANKPDLPDEDEPEADDPGVNRDQDEPGSTATTSRNDSATSGSEDDRSAHGAGDALNVAFAKGREAQMTGVARRALPGEYRDADREDEADAWRKGWDASAAVDAEG